VLISQCDDKAVVMKISVWHLVQRATVAGYTLFLSWRQSRL